MASGISNKALLEKCRRFISKDPKDLSIWPLIKDALISANREIINIDTAPLAWLRERYNELFTRAYANVSTITQADPCVVTAASSDSDVTGHGFEDDDIVFIDGVKGMDRLNRRFFRVDSINATTLGLYQLDDQNSIVSTNYDAYASGGKIYHAGIKIPHSTIEPSSGTDYKWIIKNIFAVTFDSYPATPMAEEVLAARYLASIGRPDKWRYKRYGYSSLHTSTEHYLMFNKPADKRYNIDIHIEKGYPDLATWTTVVYPPHPPEIHDCIWHRALANLTTNAEKQRRETKERLGQTIEVLYGQHWQRKALEDEKFIKDFSRNLLGGQPAQGLSVRFNNPGLSGRGSGVVAIMP